MKKYGFFKKSLLIILAILFGAAFGAAGETPVGETIVFADKSLTISASGTPLKQVLVEISQKCGVEIKGLEPRGDEPVSYVSKTGGIEVVLKDFLRHLGAKNYAFEYKNDHLLGVTVFPGLNTDLLVSDDPPNQQKEKNTFGSAVRVKGIVVGSQAQASGLMKGDIILEYNGVQIESTKDLIAATQKTTDTDQVELLVLRENYHLRFILQGGFIGVRIKTEPIVKEPPAGD